MFWKIALPALIFLISSCSWAPQKPHFFIVAIDSLPFEKINCNDNEHNKGFGIVCNEMIRFTHAYTPSILTQPALASLFTGKYPFEHGVWDNGPTFLSSKFLTSPEVAIHQGYKTLFISGGPPIWRRSGLEQGFEIFEDNISIDYKKYYREASANIKILTDFIQREGNQTPIFSTLFLNDLLFPDFPTVDNDGYPRETTYEGQVREVDESLEGLFVFLKRKKIWKNSWIILLGTSGISKEIRLNEAIGTNLFHENTNISLFIKPPEKEDHPKKQRTLDLNMSLVDVGRLLFEQIGGQFKENPQGYFKTISLSKLIFDSSYSPEDRIILSESGWPQWRNLGPTQFALQKDNYLLIQRSKPLLFNTLIDRSQVYPIDFQKGSHQILTHSAQQLLNILGSDSEDPKEHPDLIQKYRLAKTFLKSGEWNQDSIQDVEFLYLRTSDSELAGWLAGAYIDLGLWEKLLELGKKEKNTNWSWLAGTHLNRAISKPDLCLTVLYQDSISYEDKDFAEACPDPYLQVFFNHLKYRKESERRDMLIKVYRQLRTDYDIQRLNLQNGYLWDTRIHLISSPHPLYILLSTPKYQRVRRLLELSI